MLAEIFLLRIEFLLQQGAARRAMPNQSRFVLIKPLAGLRALPGRA